MLDMPAAPEAWYENDEGMQSLFCAVVNDVPDAIIIADADRQITRVNEAAIKLFGYSEEELVGQQSSILYEDYETFRRQGALRFNADNPGGRTVYEVNYRRKNCEIFPAETVGTVARDANGEILGFFGIIRDITERKRWETDLASATTRLDDALNSLHQGVLVVGADEKVLISNRRLHEMFNLVSPEIVPGRTYEEILRAGLALGQFPHSGDDTEAWVEERMESFHNPSKDAVQVPIPGGRWALATKRRTREGGCVMSYTEITRMKRLEKALADLNSITSSRTLDHDQKIRAGLELGKSHFGLAFAMISRITDDRYEVMHARTPGDVIEPGQVFDFHDTYCELTLAADGPVGFHQASTSHYCEHPCYEKFQLEAYIGAPLIVDGERYGTLSFSSPDPMPMPFTDGDRSVVALFADWIGNEMARLEEERRQSELEAELRRLATTDPLTEVCNRRAFMDLSGNCFDLARRYKRPMSIIIADIDHFKVINDTNGHEAGDEALRFFAGILKHTLRTVETIGRIGGEEFAILLPETSQDQAALAAERIANALRNSCFYFTTQPVRLTASFGVSEIADRDDDASAILRRADLALYRAKKDGRDRVSISL